MSKVVLVTGGSRSGKSSFAEDYLKEQDEVLYIATSIVTDKEMENRVKKHREMRNKKWTTFEGFKDLHLEITKHKEKYIMLDCVTIMLTNLMFSYTFDYESIDMEELDEILQHIKKEFKLLIEKAIELDKTLIMVTNEVGSGIVPENKLSRIFRDFQGFVNQFIAKKADEVYLVSCGIPLRLK